MEVATIHYWVHTSRVAEVAVCERGYQLLPNLLSPVGLYLFPMVKKHLCAGDLRMMMSGLLLWRVG